MAGNELQYGLIGLGAALVLGLFAYNAWQDRRARKHAEEAFRSTHRDVLLEEQQAEAVPPAPGGRMEPRMTADEVAEQRSEQRGEQQAAPVARNTAAGPNPASRSARAQEPGIEWDMQAIDCAIAIEAPAGISAPALFNAQQTLLAGVQKPLRWFGWDDSNNAWEQLGATTPGSFNRICASLQLADRRGVVSEHELDRFFDQLQRLCDQFLAVPRMPSKAQVMSRAMELDRFCAEVDVQIAVNIIAGEQVFAGTKIRGVSEAAGLQLHGDGTYQARDDAGRVLYALSNQEAALFSAEQLRHLHTHGLTLTVDVPRAAAPVMAFDHMVAFGEHLADALGGVLVDDNRNPLTDRSIGLIRSQASQFEQFMERQNIPSGSDVALRLFS
ncbi:MAG: cell division protein ZipA C-terminal FtsZ-binding domain-containing protein [Moraxellaceae bacterium]|nr:cell division protein ZipA C-terminal FtsZ-binding domain-containing protein [Moraxellaceae bacterium]